MPLLQFEWGIQITIFILLKKKDQRLFQFGLVK